MAGVARFIGKVAGVVAAVAQIAAFIPGPWQPIAATIAIVASITAAVAGTAAMLLAKRPPARGSPNSINIGANMPSPIVLGRTYLGGHKIHDVGYGGKVSKVQNPYSWGVFILSACAPIQAVQAVQADFTTVNFSGNAATGYYSGFLYRDAQLGTLPEPDALTPQWSGAPGWGASYKLSGYGAVGISMRFDKDGKVFSAGEPQWGFLVQGVKAYDWRKDSTFPGGMGSHRLNDRATWEWTENPALIAAQYARGWWANGKKQGGVGIDFDGLYIEQWTAFANVCDANGWKCGGVIYEPGNRWENVVRICDVGSARPYFEGHRLGVYFDAPRVAIDTITKDDLADDEIAVSVCRTYRDRVNVIVPKYRSEAHKWEYVSANDVSIAQYVTDDGEEKREEIQWDLCQDKDQAAKLAAYELMNRREIGPIEVTCKPRLIRYSAGDMLTFDLPGSVLDGLNAVIVSPPAIDPESGKVKLVMMTDAAGKHDYALGRTGVAPPVPELLNPESFDEAVAENSLQPENVTQLIFTSFQTEFLPTATDTAITIDDHVRRYADKDVNVTGDTVSGLAAETWYYLYYDDPARAGGAVTWHATTNYFDSFASETNPFRHNGGYIRTAATGGSSSGGGSLPPGGGGGNPYQLPTPEE